MSTLRSITWPLRAVAAVSALGMALLVVGGPFALSAPGRDQVALRLDEPACRRAAPPLLNAACATPAARAASVDDSGA